MAEKEKFENFIFYENVIFAQAHYCNGNSLKRRSLYLTKMETRGRFVELSWTVFVSCRYLFPLGRCEFLKFFVLVTMGRPRPLLQTQSAKEGVVAILQAAAAKCMHMSVQYIWPAKWPPIENVTCVMKMVIILGWRPTFDVGLAQPFDVRAKNVPAHFFTILCPLNDELVFEGFEPPK